MALTDDERDVLFVLNSLRRGYCLTGMTSGDEPWRDTADRLVEMGLARAVGHAYVITAKGRAAL